MKKYSIIFAVLAVLFTSCSDNLAETTSGTIATTTTSETAEITTEVATETTVLVEEKTPEPPKTFGPWGDYEAAKVLTFDYSNNLYDISEMEKYVNVEHISFDRKPSGLYNLVDNLSGKLKTLEVSDLFISKFDVNNFSDVGTLTKLEITDVAYANASINLFKDYIDDSLTYLRIEGGSFDDISGISHFKDFPNFNNLALYSTSVIDITPILELKNLQQLTLPESTLTDENIALLLENLPNLKGLNTYKHGEYGLNGVKSSAIVSGELSEPVFRANPPQVSSGIGEVIEWKSDGNNDFVEKIVRDELCIYEGEITTEDVLEISEFNFEYDYYTTSNKDEFVTDFSDLRYVKNLTAFHFPKNTLDDYSVISELENLFGLYFNGSDMSEVDLSFISEKKNLRYLGMSSCNLTDISFVEPLGNLTQLDLGANLITDISPLKNLENLGKLDLEMNRISDLSPLENGDFRRLFLRDNYITDWSPVKHIEDVVCDQITKSTLVPTADDDVEITGLYFPADTKSFSVRMDIDAHGNILPDDELIKIAGFKNLEELSLDIDGSQYEIISHFPNLKTLKIWQLDLDKNENYLVDIVNEILNMKELEKLELWSLDDEALQALSEYETECLKELDLNYLKTADLSPILKLTSLERLHMNGEYSYDFSQLKNLPSLKILSFYGAEKYDLTPLYAFQNLEKVYLSYCDVTQEELDSFKKALPNCELILGG